MVVVTGLSRKQVLGWSWKLKRCMGSEISIKKEMGGSRIGQRSWQVAVTKGKAMSSQGATGQRSPSSESPSGANVNRPFLHPFTRASADPWLENWGRSPGKLTVRPATFTEVGRFCSQKSIWAAHLCINYTANMTQNSKTK